MAKTKNDVIKFSKHRIKTIPELTNILMVGFNMNLKQIFSYKIGPRTMLKSIRVYMTCKAGSEGQSFGTLLVAGSTKTVLSKNARIINKGSFMFGLRPRYFNPSVNRCLLLMESGGKLKLQGHNIRVGPGTSITILKDACLELGDNVYINSNTSIVCSTHITVGARSAISWGVEICDRDGHMVKREGAVAEAPIEIGSDALIGRKAMIMKGVHIGNGSVVAAGALVTHDVPDKCVVAGIPARVIRENIEIDWHNQASVSTSSSN